MKKLISPIINLGIIVLKAIFPKIKIGKIEQVIEQVDHALDIANKIAPGINPKAAKISGIAKSVVTEIETSIQEKTVEEKRQIAQDSLTKILESTGHKQSKDEKAIAQAISRLIK